MVRQIFNRAVFFLGFIAISNLAFAESTNLQKKNYNDEGQQIIKVGYIEFPPVFSTNADGDAEGSLIDLAAKVIPEAGYDWNPESFPTKRMINHIITGKLDLWIGLSTIPAFEGKTYIGTSSLERIEMNAYWIGNKQSIAKKEDLIGKDILIMRGYSYGGMVNFIKDPANKVNYREIDNHKLGLLMLEAKRADYFLDYRGPIKNALSTLKREIKNLNHNVISSFDAKFVVSKKTINGKQVLQDLEKAYKKLVEAGELNKIE